jgi:hypothetical protein
VGVGVGVWYGRAVEEKEREEKRREEKRRDENRRKGKRREEEDTSRDEKR